MDAKDLRTEAALGDRTKDGTANYTQSERPKTYQDAGSSPMAKVEAGPARPCAVIGPDRVLPPGARRPDQWPPDNRQPPAYPHKPLDYHHPSRNISPRQTFQENMQRIMVPPSYPATKPKEDHNFQLQPDMSPLRSNKVNVSTETKFSDAPYPTMPTVRDLKNTRVSDICVPKLNVSTETKYYDVPYPSNPIINDPKTIRTSDISVSHTNSVVTRSVQGWPSGAPPQPSKPYGASELFQFPDYHATPRPMVMGLPHRTVQEVSGMAAEPYYHDGNIRFKPYPTSKERYPQARYDFVSNYPNSMHAPPFTTHKAVPANPYPQYSQVPLKYMDTRMSDSLMNAYQRPQNPQAAYSNISFRNPVIHPSYGPVQGNCLQTNKFYPYPDTTAKPMAPSKLPPYPDYESARPKPYHVQEGFYINDIARPHLMKSQVMPPNYPNPNMHMVHPHPYYRKDNVSIKNFDHSGHYRPIDPSINVNNSPLPRFATQFANGVQMSPSDLMTNNTPHMMQPNLHNFSEDFGYISQSSASTRSYDSGISRFSNDPFRRYDYNNYGPAIKTSLPSNCELHSNNNQGCKDKKDLDVRQFLQMWNEGEEENENSLKDNGNKTVTLATGVGTQTLGAITQSPTQEQLYVMGIVNVPSEELDKYEHIQKVSKLPENIKGYNSIEILHKFEEVIESSKLNEHKGSASSPRNFRGPMKNSMSFQSMQAMPSRPLSPFDVEAKISQSVIHKDVGCNFEIRPCSPKMMNVERATPIQNVISERIIEKVTNPVVPTTPNVLNSIDNANVNHTIHVESGDQSVPRNENNIKQPCCKMSDDSYSNLNIDSIAKPSYSYQDLESNSGVCFSSLPRLDNDIELSFPEVNQQFINANKIDSVITTTAVQDLPLLDKEDEIENSKENQEAPKFDSETPTLTKHRKHRRKSIEPTERNVESKVKAVRTDSVIIKNPDTYKNIEAALETSLEIDSGENSQKVPINLTINTEHYESNIKKNDKICEDLAIDFSFSSNDHCADYSQTQNMLFNKRKDSGPEQQSAEEDNQGPQNFKFDSRVDDLHCIGYTTCNLDKETPKDCVESITLEKESHYFQANEELSGLGESTQTDFPDTIEKSGRPCISKSETKLEETTCTGKEILAGETTKIRPTPFLFSSNVYDSQGPGIETKEVERKHYCNEDIKDVEKDIPKPKELLDLNRQPLKSLCQSFIQGDHIPEGIKMDICERSRSNSCESILFEYPEHECFNDSLDQRDRFSKCNNEEYDADSYRRKCNDKNIKNMSTSTVITIDDDKMLEESENIFLKQPLTPMDVTPASSITSDDADDCFFDSETEKIDAYDYDNSTKINEQNMQIQRTSYFSKELFSPWIRKLILREGDYDHKPQKYILLEPDWIPESSSELVETTEKGDELSENLKSMVNPRDVQVIFDPDTTKSDPSVGIVKTSDIDPFPDLVYEKDSELVDSEDPILSDNKSVEEQSDTCIQVPDCEETAAFTNENVRKANVPLQIIDLSDKLAINNIELIQDPVNSNNAINTFTLDTAKFGITSCASASVTVTHGFTPEDSVPNKESRPADPVANVDFKPADSVPKKDSNSEDSIESEPADFVPIEKFEPADIVLNDQSEPADSDPKKQSERVDSVPKDKSEPAESVSYKESELANSVSKDKSEPADSVPNEEYELTDSVPKDKSELAESVPYTESEQADSVPKDKSEPAESAPYKESEQADSVPKDKSDPAESVSYKESEQVDSVPKDKSEPADSVPYKESEQADSVSKDKSEPADSVPYKESEQADSVPKDNSESVECVPNEESELADSVPKDKSKPADSFPNEQSELADYVAKDESELVDIIPNEETEPVELVLNNESKPAESVPKEDFNPANSVPKEDFNPADSVSNNESESADSFPYKESQPANSVPNNEYKPADSVPKKDSKPTELVPNKESKPADFVSNKESKPSELILNEEFKLVDSVFIEDTKPADCVPKEDSKPADFVSNKESKPAEFIFNEEFKLVDSVSIEYTKSADSVPKEGFEPADSVPKEGSQLADSVPKEISKLSSLSHSRTKLGSKCKFSSYKNYETIERDPRIINQSELANLNSDEPCKKRIDDTESIYPKQNTMFDMSKVEIVKKLPRNCLEALKNEYASDSEESVTDNEVERIKYEYASDTDELIENDPSCDKNNQFNDFCIDKNSKEDNKTAALPCEKLDVTTVISTRDDMETVPLILTKSLEVQTTVEFMRDDKKISKEANLERSNGLELETVYENSTSETENCKNDSQISSFDLTMQGLTESEKISLTPDVKIWDEPTNIFSSHAFSSKKPNSMKRSLSETDLSSLTNNNKSETTALWSNKRRKLADAGDKLYQQMMITDNCRNIIQNSRRNSLSSVCNETNVSYCIFIDNGSLLPENCSESEKIQCITEIAEDCLSCVHNDPIVGGIDSSAEIVSFVEEMNEYSNSYPAEECTIDDEDADIQASWVDDVACVETVVSEDIAEDIIIGASTPLGESPNTEYDEEESEVLNINDHSEKVKYIYGDKMCSNDAQLLETLYRTPQMNVNQKLINKESPDADEDYRYYNRDSLEKVLSESSSNVSNPEVVYEPESVAFNTSSLYSPGLEVLENGKENMDLDTFSDPASPFDEQRKGFVSNEDISAIENCDKTQDHTVHSCESSIDNVFSYNQKEDTPKCVISSSPEVSSTTSEERNSTILLKITNLRNARVSPPTFEDMHKRISCKYTETNDYLNSDVRTPARPLLTKAAQKYIPPLKETIPNLKVKLTLPQHSLLRLKQMKVTKENPTLSIKVENRPNVLDIENIPNVVPNQNITNVLHIQNIPNEETVNSRPKLVNSVRKDIPKKVKPKFEDVLKSIEETQIQMHKEKSKKTKKAVPKVVIKKNGNGSHYASTSDSDTSSAPDLTGSKWQPWVFLEKNPFIDKMAVKGKTLAVYSHRKKTYVLAEHFKKYKSILTNTKFVISKPKLEQPSSGRLKYTIRVKHSH